MRADLPKALHLKFARQVINHHIIASLFIRFFEHIPALMLCAHDSMATRSTDHYLDL
jgi:hypothetical protein